ncbi:class II aaRS and biotin synthetase, partial [Piedraia hortae CBS 480.64]
GFTAKGKEENLTVAGRLTSVRTAGNKLIFLDLTDGPGGVQAVVNELKLGGQGQLEGLRRVCRRGDWYSVTGQPHRTKRGELSILASSVPELLSPSLHQIPAVLNDAETIARKRHVDLLVNRPSAVLPLLVRHGVEEAIQKYFNGEGFVKVNTPILSGGAGGAAARPFATTATELEGEKLHLRIAPELWLKRLVVGGLGKVYEMGPAFRNEGVDATHNPEFSICEFYEAFASLQSLMTRTEHLFQAIQLHVQSEVDLKGPYKRIEFLPALEQHLTRRLPDLSDPAAREEVFSLAGTHLPSESLPAEPNPSLPRVLDALASHFLEDCTQPTFIVHHPACMSPLAKHFKCATTGQAVAARAELFIAGREMANMYEEENSPVEQRKKFQLQQEVGGLDEQYCQVLEWGLPPTGGWGCGIDRLVMLLSGEGRIGDVLPFGTLRHVVGLGKP